MKTKFFKLIRTLFADGQIQNVIHKGTELSFAIPNALSRYRVNSFASKEPETLDWIDTIPGGGVLWDVGANVGLYSCYAAKSRGIRVFSFEPSVFNLQILSKNIFLNKLVELITVVPLPLTDSLKLSTFNMSSVDAGGALSTFGESYGDDGKPLKILFEVRMLGISMDIALSLLKIPPPTHIKIDVDGIEHLILAGGKDVLMHAEEVMIEINENFSYQVKSTQQHLNAAGLTYSEKRHSSMISNSTRWSNTYNQLWRRV